MCTCIVHWQCANNTKTTFPHCPGSLAKGKNKNPRDAIFSDHPLGRDTSPRYVCVLVLYIGNAQTTQKHYCPIDHVACQKEKIKIRATRIFSYHPLGRDTSPTYVCALALYIGNAQTTQKQHCPIDQGAWQKGKKNPRDADFSDHPLGRDTSPTYVCTLVLYIGNAQTSQKQHCPIDQGAWQKEKIKILATRISPTTHWVVTQILGTCVYLYCTLAMCKQHKNKIALLTRELGKRKKIPATRIICDHPRGRDTSPTYVCALVLYIGNAQTTQKQHCPVDQGAWQKEKKSVRRGFLRPPTGS